MLHIMLDFITSNFARPCTGVYARINYTVWALMYGGLSKHMADFLIIRGIPESCKPGTLLSITLHLWTSPASYLYVGHPGKPIMFLWDHIWLINGALAFFSIQNKGAKTKCIAWSLIKEYTSLLLGIRKRKTQLASGQPFFAALKRVLRPFY